MTRAEQKLWTQLRRKKLGGLRFRRQHPVGRYIADFYCHELKLVIELDGFSHENREEYDANRDSFLSGGGYTVLRFTNVEIEQSLDAVLDVILAKASEIAH